MVVSRVYLVAGIFLAAVSLSVADLGLPLHLVSRTQAQTAPVAATPSLSGPFANASPARTQAPAGETFGAKLRRLAAAAAISNSITSPPLLPAPEWTPNHAYVQGEVVRNGPNLYISYASGTSAASGGPTGTGYASISDGTAGWAYHGPSVVTVADPAAPTISSAVDMVTLAAQGLVKTYNPLVTPSSFVFGGGLPTPAPAPKATTQVAFPAAHANAGKTGGNVGLDDGTNSYYWSVTFVTDAPIAAIGVSFGAPATIVIDGRRLLPGGYRIASAANPVWFILDFTSAGGRKQRTITLEEYGNIRFAGVRIDASSNLWAPSPADNVRVAFLGSSIESGSSAFPPLGSLAWPIQASKLLGWSDPWNLGLGGTGYITNQRGRSFTYAEHVYDAIRISPDIVVIGGPINDAGSASPPTLAAAAVSLFRTLRAALPTVPIIAMGTFPGSTGPSAAKIRSEFAIRNAVQWLEDPRIFFIPVISAPCGMLISGTGTAAAPNGTGNADFYISYDRIHPTQHGIDYEAIHFAEKIKSIVVGTLP